MKPISQHKVLAMDTPTYATIIPSRGPKPKFCTAQVAKQAISYRTRGSQYDFNLNRHMSYRMSEMELYRHDPATGGYVLIWDSNSELAEAVKRGKLTLKEMYAILEL